MNINKKTEWRILSLEEKIRRVTAAHEAGLNKEKWANMTLEEREAHVRKQHESGIFFKGRTLSESLRVVREAWKNKRTVDGSKPMAATKTQIRRLKKMAQHETVELESQDLNRLDNAQTSALGVRDYLSENLSNDDKLRAEFNARIASDKEFHESTLGAIADHDHARIMELYCDWFSCWAGEKIGQF